MPLSTDEKIALGVAAAVGGSIAVFLVGKQLFPTAFSTTVVQQVPKVTPVQFNRDGSVGLNLFSENESPRDPTGPVLI